jgi:hypothetical protein
MMKGVQFRRQRPVLNYIADFMYKELMIVIEVDGISHHYDEVKTKDQIKEDALIKAGFVVIRFRDDDVLKDIKNVTRVIEDIVDKQSLLIPLPAPPAGDKRIVSSAGGGGLSVGGGENVACKQNTYLIAYFQPQHSPPSM